MQDNQQSDSNAESRANAPRIYVASLADYNAGRLHGRWIDADQDIDVIRDEIAAMLAESSEPVAEEWAIHDYENFAELSLSEFEDPEKVARAAHLIVEHGPMFAGLLNNFGGLDGLEQAEDCMKHGYRGAYNTLADFARESCEDAFSEALEALPGFIRHHIDYAGVARALQLDGTIFTIQCDGRFHVFDANL
ncbi:MAG: antirestriction protein ArdA [Tepidisphaeraceae bacterium]|jgi:antirestriction protein